MIKKIDNLDSSNNLNESLDEITNCEITVNTVKIKEKKNIVKISLFILFVLILVSALLVLFLAGDITPTIAYDNLVLKATLAATLRTKLSGIKSIELISNFKSGTKILGTDLYTISAGTYQNDAYGNFYLYCYNNVKKHIVLTTKEDGIIVFNLKTIENTNKYYNYLKSQLGL